MYLSPTNAPQYACREFVKFAREWDFKHVTSSTGHARSKAEDLSWNVHIEHIVKKANKRLYALRTLKKSNLTIMQLVQVYCSIVRSVLEYACPAKALR